MARNMNFMFALLVVIAIAWLALLARGCGGSRVPEFINPRLSLEEARAKAEEIGKPVFILVSADWCPHCAALKRTALAGASVASRLKSSTVPVYVDASKVDRKEPEIMTLMDRLGVNSIPAMILERKGAPLSKVEGELTSAEVTAWLDRVVGPPTPAGAPPAPPK